MSLRRTTFGRLERERCGIENAGQAARQAELPLEIHPTGEPSRWNGVLEATTSDELRVEHEKGPDR
jgi:hypothetical protein